MPLTLAQAAAETGLHRSSILRAIKRGAVSGSRDAGGQWSIEPAELFRVFPPVVPVPTFVSLCSTLAYERRNQRDISNSMILVWLWI